MRKGRCMSLIERLKQGSADCGPKYTRLRHSLRKASQRATSSFSDA